MADVVSQSTYCGMGTVVSCVAYGSGSEEAVKEAGNVISELERKLSRFQADSEIGKINSSAGARPERVSEGTCRLLERALELSGLSGGRFDITVGPLMDLWGDFACNDVEPDAGAIDEALDLVDYRDLVIDSDRSLAFLKRRRQRIDLGAIGKGYAADQALARIKDCGVNSAYVNIGGNVAALGKKPDGSYWNVGILHPRNLDALIGSIAVTDKSVVTSGDYYRGYESGNGKRLHHILDTNTGYPVDSGIISATVVSDCSLIADALSTILFMAGAKEALKFLSEFKGSDAILVDDNLDVFISEGIANAFSAADNIRPVVLK